MSVETSPIETPLPQEAATHCAPLVAQCLVRYGAVSEVVRALCDSPREGDKIERGDTVILETPRGVFAGTFLERLAGRHAAQASDAIPYRLVRVATPDDVRMLEELRTSAREEFIQWSARIAEWKLDLALIDTEWAHDLSCLVLYVLGGRGAETTRLALNAVGIGVDSIVVQPVDANGPVPVEATGGSCGSGGSCGCG